MINIQHNNKYNTVKLIVIIILQKKKLLNLTKEKKNTNTDQFDFKLIQLTVTR